MALMRKGEVRMQIKFVDLAAMNDEIRERVDREMAEIHKNTAYIGGPHVEAFEKEFARFSRRASRDRSRLRNRRTAPRTDGA